MQTGTDKVDQKGQHGNYLVCNCRIGSKTDGIDELRYGYRKQQKLHALGLGLPVGNGRQNNTYHRGDAPDVLPGKANAQHPEQDKYRKQDIVFFRAFFFVEKNYFTQAADAGNRHAGICADHGKMRHPQYVAYQFDYYHIDILMRLCHFSY